MGTDTGESALSVLTGTMGSSAMAGKPVSMVCSSCVLAKQSAIPIRMIYI